MMAQRNLLCRSLTSHILPIPTLTPSRRSSGSKITDVKFVPKVCYGGKDSQKFYQYTIIEEASRKRFIYAYEENSSYSTIDSVK